MARIAKSKETSLIEAEDQKTAAPKLTAREKEFRALVDEFKVIFSDLSLNEVKSLATMNQIADPTEKGLAIQYFWQAKKVNG